MQILHRYLNCCHYWFFSYIDHSSYYIFKKVIIYSLSLNDRRSSKKNGTKTLNTLTLLPLFNASFSSIYSSLTHTATSKLATLVQLATAQWLIVGRTSVIWGQISNARTSCIWGRGSILLWFDLLLKNLKYDLYFCILELLFWIREMVKRNVKSQWRQ
jgi:hypothetical protein